MPATYFLLVRLFDRVFGPLELGARIPSALAFAFGLMIVFDCARRLSDSLHALAAMALLACSLLPYYGYEARLYSPYFMFVAMGLGAAVFLGFTVHSTRRLTLRRLEASLGGRRPPNRLRV